MCGIVGLASTEPINDSLGLTVGAESLRHRGPDDGGEWWSTDKMVGLAHRRLAIVDLSDAGHQPMAHSDGSAVVVFNGEIYNHRILRRTLSEAGHQFRSESDTEVILAAYRQWNRECVTRFNGMFAFAIYDARERKLFFARDRAGEKPLYYTLERGRLRFASELKAFLSDVSWPRSIDPEGLDCYLAMGFVPGALSILRGMQKLPPAHAMEYDLATGELTTWRYWVPPSAPLELHDPAFLLEELEALLTDSIAMQLTADVPVGVLLSGGVDSSLVTALAARATSRLKTFTVRFPGLSHYDESEHARLIAGHFGTDHHELDAKTISVDLLPTLARQFDEPVADSSMIPTYLVCQLIREHCTVALGGDGGDELFGGYPHYSRLIWLEERLQGLPWRLRQALVAPARRVMPQGMRGRNWVLAAGTDLAREVPAIDVLFDAEERRRLTGTSRAHLVAETVRAARLPRDGVLVDRAMRMDFANYLPEDILVKVDRASMLTSLEVRAPFLDHRIIEFAFGQVSPRQKASASDRKVLLKELARRILPPRFDRQRKQGFSVPLDLWLKRGEWRDMIADVLLASDSMFDRRRVLALLNGQRRGCRNGERLFALAMFELWRREYKLAI